jgi:hypothetical protein
MTTPFFLAALSSPFSSGLPSRSCMLLLFPSAIGLDPVIGTWLFSRKKGRKNDIQFHFSNDHSSCFSEAVLPRHSPPERSLPWPRGVEDLLS